ncbi:hypothetical protein FB446DRAFT_49024 [Lentinula raphanica]|nr:hypothetical protein FB446DRAFT_49024 [Lentinula raphanica]
MVRQPLRSSLSATVIIRLFPHLCCSISLLTTAESILMGSESFTLLYPTLVNEGVVLPMSGYGVGMPRNLDHTLLWRCSQGGRWTATWNWGGLADNDKEKELDWGSFEWKIGHDCINPCCGWKNRIPVVTKAGANRYCYV